MPAIAELVEPDKLRESAGEYLHRAGEFLRTAGAVNLVDAGPMRVSAQVHDGGVGRATELAATPSGLSIRCDCPTGSEGRWCPHTVATAMETWSNDPGR